MKKLRFYIIPLLVLAMLLVSPPTARAEAPTTTVMMYMCGTDLQSACVEDMYEMASVDLPEEVTVAVQAGGAYTWDDEDLTGEAINRFTITYGTFNDLEVLPWQSMADKETLTDFVAWAVDSYPADRYILVLWDHGGGSTGVCFDETANYDSLTIHEVNDALHDYSQQNPDFHLDIVGFDACLMATYEMAVHMAQYADYMVASEELEPGIGWNYLGWLSDLANDTGMDSADIAVSIADNFMSACLEDNPNDYPCRPSRFPRPIGNLRRLPVGCPIERPAAHHQPLPAAYVFLWQVLRCLLRPGRFHSLPGCHPAVCPQHGKPAGKKLSGLHLLLHRHGHV